VAGEAFRTLGTCSPSSFHASYGAAQSACAMPTSSLLANFASFTGGGQYVSIYTAANKIIRVYTCPTGYDFDNSNVNDLKCVTAAAPTCPAGTWVYHSASSNCVPSQWEGVNVEGVETILVALGLVVLAALGFIAARLR